MPQKKKNINWVNLSIGIILIGLNLLWIFYLGDELIDDYFTKGKSDYSYPISDWITILNAACGLSGIILAVLLIKDKINAWKVLPINFALLSFCVLINIYLIENFIYTQ